MFLNKYTLSYPLCLIGIVLMISGFRWLINSEPWMLDEVANVERLGMTFETLFEPEINASLPGYLTQIYRFLGLYVVGIGTFLLAFSSEKILKLPYVRIRIFYVLGTLLIVNLILAYNWIPSSHFIYLMWAAFILFLISLYSHIKMISYEK